MRKIGNDRRRFYLASRYSRREEMVGVAEAIEGLGHVVTSRWINGNHQAENDQTAAMRVFAQDDLEDVISAHHLIAFTEMPREPTTNRGGRHVELGVALGQGKAIWTVGPNGGVENVFHALPSVVNFESWDGALAHLQLIYGEAR